MIPAQNPARMIVDDPRRPRIVGKPAPASGKPMVDLNPQPTPDPTEKIDPKQVDDSIGLGGSAAAAPANPPAPAPSAQPAPPSPSGQPAPPVNTLPPTPGAGQAAPSPDPRTPAQQSPAPRPTTPVPAPNVVPRT